MFDRGGTSNKMDHTRRLVLWNSNSSNDVLIVVAGTSLLGEEIVPKLRKPGIFTMIATQPGRDRAKLMAPVDSSRLAGLGNCSNRVLIIVGAPSETYDQSGLEFQ